MEVQIVEAARLARDLAGEDVHDQQVSVFLAVVALVIRRHGLHRLGVGEVQHPRPWCISRAEHAVIELRRRRVPLRAAAHRGDSHVRGEADSGHGRRTGAPASDMPAEAEPHTGGAC
ncbi:MAG: hypothetical protein ACTHU0_13545 [Kofleriaceae bacterium]